MTGLFHIVYLILHWISELTGFSYNEINIIVYYIILPFIYIWLADRIWKKHILKIVYITLVAVTLFLIPDFASFSNWLFDRSVDFLNSFGFLGWNYVEASVWICVIFPGIVLLIMLCYAFPRFKALLIGKNMTLKSLLHPKTIDEKTAKNKQQPSTNKPYHMCATWSLILLITTVFLMLFQALTNPDT